MSTTKQGRPAQKKSEIPKKKSTYRPRESGKTLRGSREAKKSAAIVLEVLSGVRAPKEASEALGCSPPSYYKLEARALQGLVSALEPVPRGRRKKPEDRIEELKKEKKRLQVELSRAQALVRMANRSLGLKSLERGRARTKAAGKRSHRPRVRAKKVVGALRRSEDVPSSEESGKEPKSSV